MKERTILTIHKNNGAFKDSDKKYEFEIDNNGSPENLNYFVYKKYEFGIDNNGSPENMNDFIYKMLIDMDRKKLIDIHEINELIDYNYGMSINNIVKNISIPVNNIKENIKIITNKNKENDNYVESI